MCACVFLIEPYYKHWMFAMTIDMMTMEVTIDMKFIGPWLRGP